MVQTPSHFGTEEHIDAAMPPGFYAQPILDLSRALIGCELLVEGVGGPIIETEAYEAGDPASHSFAGPTARNSAMFGPGGRLYVYRIYGMHWCLNIVGGLEAGSAVLIRAIEPAHGVERMRERRRTDDPRKLCAGPGRLCEALGVTGAGDGLPLDRLPFELRPRAAEPAILVGPRIGITKAAEKPWRFGLAGSRYLSRPFPPP
ncbi:MAG TPA: DNA-3-methyladenine glycosylase [Sphingomonas sp.]|jgi:DNA-3-methyladenine glycosylase